MNYILYKYKYFFSPRAWDQGTLDFYPAASQFFSALKQHHWLWIQQVLCFITSMFVSMFQWWQLDIIWTNYSRSYPLLISLWRSNGFTFLCTKSHAYPRTCSLNNVCSDPWEPQVPRAGREGTSEDSLHAHGAHLCSLLQPPLTPQWAPNIPTLHVDIWLLLTHSNYLSEIPKCLTVQPAQSRRAAAPQTSHRKLSIPSFPISTPTWMKLFNITPKQSIGKQGWKGRFLLITKTTTRGEKVDFSFKSFCMKGNSVKGEHCCHRKFIVMQDFNTRFTFKILQVWKSLSLHLNPSTSGLTPWIIV